MTENTIVLSDDSSSEENSSSAPPAFATKSTSSSSQDPPRRNIAVKKGASAPQPAIPANLQYKKKDIETLQSSSNFLDNFNPQNSRREKNKRRLQQHMQPRAPPKKNYYTNLYDEQGRLKSSGADICDCFDVTCEGCHFPCYYCGSQKCAIRCRNNRKFMYDSIEHDGKDFVANNPMMMHLN